MLNLGQIDGKAGPKLNMGGRMQETELPHNFHGTWLTELTQLDSTFAGHDAW